MLLDYPDIRLSYLRAGHHVWARGADPLSEKKLALNQSLHGKTSADVGALTITCLFQHKDGFGVSRLSCELLLVPVRSCASEIIFL